jgi:hypothetical protein
MAGLVERSAGADLRARSADRGLRERARAVIPGRMYGHQNAGPLPAEYPQFMRSGRVPGSPMPTAASTST